MASKGVFLLFHYLFLLTLPPFFLGVIAKTKAFFAGRKGPPLLQAYFDIAKLLRKQRVYSKSGSFLTSFAPLVILACYLAAGSLLTLLGPSPLHFEGDLILFAYLFACARFTIILAAMDVGSSFEGMGASREATFGAFSELALFVGLIVLAVSRHSTSLNHIFQANGFHPMVEPALFLLFLSFFFILLTENSRMPIDDPNTHLELTMIHEVMILDVGGPDLGLMFYNAAVKLFIFSVLTVLILWPPSGNIGYLEGVLVFLKTLGVAVFIGIVESVTARVKLMKVPQLLIANFVVTALALLVIFFGKGN